MKKDEKKKYLETAKVISIISTPAIVGTLLLIYTFYEFSESTEIFFKSLGAVFFFSVFLPVLFTFYLMQKNKVKNFHMIEREERKMPFGFALVASVVSLLAIKYLNSNLELTRMIMTLYLMALGFVTITFLKYKISGHTFIFSSAIFILVSFLDLRFIYLFPLVILIGWARVYLKEHSLGEVLGGVGYALISFIVFSILFSS